MNSTQIAALPQAQNGGAMVPLAEIERAASYIASSGLFGVKTKEQATALMLVAQSEGSHYARAAMDYDVIQGRPALKSSTILSRFQNAGGKINYKQTTDLVCEVELSHPQGGTMVVKWDMERAKNAELGGKGTWAKYPAQMLRARAVSEGVRALFPACLGGFYATEEVQDFAPPEQSKAEKPTQAKASAKAVDAEVVRQENSLKVNIDGATPPLPPAWLKPLQTWIKSLKDSKKAAETIKKYCPLDKLHTLGQAQVGSLTLELSAIFDEFAPNLDQYFTQESPDFAAREQAGEEF